MRENNRRFEGTYTALITPFLENEEVDYDSIEQLVEMQLEAKVNGLVLIGTTAESPTLRTEEQKTIVRRIISQVNNQCQVIMGTGSNCTQKTIEMSEYAKSIGADGILVVCPYYNKPTQEGLYRHYRMIADSVDIPLIVYNIPGRSGVNIEIATLMRLARENENICAVKEASGNINQIEETIRRAPEGFNVLSGDDSKTIPVMRAGGRGIISVASNIVPNRITEMVNYALKNDFESAENINRELAPLYQAMTVETNPIPIKYMMSRKNICNEIYRMPMCELSDDHKIYVNKLMESARL